MNNPQSQRIPVQLSQTTGYVCSNCGHNVFAPKVLLRKISRFISGDDMDTAVPVDIIVCDKCGEPAKDIIPKEVAQILFPDVSNDGQSDDSQTGVVKSL